MLWKRSACELLAMLERGDTTSVEIVTQLQERAQEVEPLLNGYAVTMWEDALEVAEQADLDRASGKQLGPLHGLPLSIKENIDVAGVDSTLGLVNRTNKPAERDAVIVSLAHAAGAIIIGKTNVPQALIPFHCTNPVYGESFNPWRRDHVTGGSSSGEGVVIASGSSVMGVGSDLGGSIRFPASFCGIAGLKPTNTRWSNKGSNTAIAGQEVIRAQIGPMARHVDDLILLMKAFANPEHTRLDPLTPPVAFSMEALSPLSGVKIGYFRDDGFLTPSKANQRAVELAMQAVEAAGATLIPMPPTNQLDVLKTYVGAVSSDGMETLRVLMEGETLVDPIKNMWRLGHVPNTVREIASAFLPWIGEERMAHMVGTVGRKSVAELWKIAAMRNMLRQNELEDWERLGVEALLCPATVLPAPPIAGAEELTLMFSYFGRYNLFGMPAGVVPVTRMLPAECKRVSSRDRLEHHLASAQEKSAGLPVNVQVVGLPWQDERVLQVMQCIQAFAFALPTYPRTPVTPQG